MTTIGAIAEVGVTATEASAAFRLLGSAMAAAADQHDMITAVGCELRAKREPWWAVGRKRRWRRMASQAIARLEARASQHRAAKARHGVAKVSVEIA